MKANRKYISLLLAIGMLTSSIAITFGSSETPSYASVGEGDDAYMSNELLMEEDSSDWDHETWDEEHQEMAWVALATTTWGSTIPPLKFSGKGTATIKAGTAQTWVDSNTDISSAINGVVDLYDSCEDKEGYKTFIKALVFTMHDHSDNINTLFDGSEFKIKSFLIGASTPTGDSVLARQVDSAKQVARRVMDNRSDADDIYTKEGVSKVLNAIIRSGWVNNFIDWFWDKAYLGVASSENAGYEYEMSGWLKLQTNPDGTYARDDEGNFIPVKTNEGKFIGRLDNLGEDPHSYTSPSRKPSSSASASTPT